MSEKIDVRKIREEKQISLQRAFEDTKISKRILEAIESGDLSDLFMSPVYIKGFVKTYARYLGIDPQALVNQLFENKLEENKANTNSTDNTVKRTLNNKSNANRLFTLVKRAAYFVKSIFVVIFVFILGHVLKLPKKFWVGIGIFLLAIIVALAWPSSKNNVAKHYKRETVSTTKSTKASKNSNSLGSKDRHSSGVNILVEAKQDCWLRVKCDGTELFRGTLHQGDIEKWQAKKRISLWVGNAGALKITCNGKVYRDIGREGQVIKELVFLPDGSYHIKKR